MRVPPSELIVLIRAYRHAWKHAKKDSRRRLQLLIAETRLLEYIQQMEVP